MSCTKELSEVLQGRGFRMTPQRHAIMHILKTSPDHLSPAQVFEQACQSIPGMTETTVYRTLEFLVENGIILSTQHNGGHLTYELSGLEHHHLVCRTCGTQLDIEPDIIQKAIDQLEQQTRYQINAGHITFFGLCPACQGKFQ
jgi:Fe2+ or Zn2+ uptake regulation protein